MKKLPLNKLRDTAGGALDTASKALRGAAGLVEEAADGLDPLFSLRRLDARNLARLERVTPVLRRCKTAEIRRELDWKYARAIDGALLPEGGIAYRAGRLADFCRRAGGLDREALMAGGYNSCVLPMLSRLASLERELGGLEYELHSVPLRLQDSAALWKTVGYVSAGPDFDRCRALLRAGKDGAGLQPALTALKNRLRKNAEAVSRAERLAFGRAEPYAGPDRTRLFALRETVTDIDGIEDMDAEALLRALRDYSARAVEGLLRPYAPQYIPREGE